MAPKIDFGCLLSGCINHKGGNAGPVEFCVNDNVLTDNSGAWGMEVLVDETSIP